MNCKAKMPGKSFYFPSLKVVAWLESVQLRLIFSIHLSIIFSRERRQSCGKRYKQVYGKLKT